NQANTNTNQANSQTNQMNTDQANTDQADINQPSTSASASASASALASAFASASNESEPLSCTICNDNSHLRYRCPTVPPPMRERCYKCWHKTQCHKAIECSNERRDLNSVLIEEGYESYVLLP